MSKTYKILIVDDEKEILDALEASFLITPYEVFTTNDPLIALDMIKKDHFNAVISDISMPQMNGLELLKKIKQYNAFIQVIMITGYITVSNALDAFRYGAADCFFKPFENPDKIIESVNECARKMERINKFINKIVAFEKDEN